MIDSSILTLPKNALRGSFPPLVTPFRDGEVDYAAFERLVEFQIAGGSQGVLVNGTTAEPSTLTLAERAELVRVAIRVADGRLPVVAATGGQSYADTVWLTRSAEEAGASAVLVVTPYYIQPSQAGLIEYFVSVYAETSLPSLLYHIPGRAAVSVTVSTLEAIAERSENFVGMKHAVADLALVSAAIERLGPDFRIMCGLEELSLPMLSVGAQGLMSAVGNLLPGRVAELWRSVDEGRLPDARAVHFELLSLNRAVFFDTNPIPMKYMMRRLGLLERNEHRLPMLPAPKELESRLDDVLKLAGLL